MKLAGAPHRRPAHQHTCGTLLALLKAHPEAARAIRRHSRISTAMAAYTHAVGDCERNPARCQPWMTKTPSRYRLGVFAMVGLTGFEPVASSLSGMRSNQLSYSPAALCGVCPAR